MQYRNIAFEYARTFDSKQFRPAGNSTVAAGQLFTKG
jgi:hypothetical protein